MNNESSNLFKWAVLAAVVYFGYQFLNKPPQPGPTPGPAPSSWSGYINAAGMTADDKAKLGASMAAIADAVVIDGNMTAGGEPIEPRLGYTADIADILTIVVRYQALQRYPLDPLAAAIKTQLGITNEALPLTPEKRAQIARVLNDVAAACR